MASRCLAALSHEHWRVHWHVEVVLHLGVRVRLTDDIGSASRKVDGPADAARFLVTRLVTIALFDEAYFRVNGVWRYASGPSARTGQFIDVLVCASATRTRPAGSSRER